jgi:hypothetical protein
MHACMHACLFVPLPLCDVSIISGTFGAVVVSRQHPVAVCAAALPGLLHVFQCTHLCSLMPGLTAALETCVLYL